MKVGISRAVLDQIVRHAAGHPAEEVCGLLLGRTGRIETARPAANLAPDRARMFELDPTVLFEAHRAQRAGGPDVLGHYHSHPNGNSSPSAADADESLPGVLWLIVAGGRASLFEARRAGSIHGCFDTVELEVC